VKLQNSKDESSLLGWRPVLPESNTWEAWEEFLARTEPWISQGPLGVSV